MRYVWACYLLWVSFYIIVFKFSAFFCSSSYDAALIFWWNLYFLLFILALNSFFYYWICKIDSLPFSIRLYSCAFFMIAVTFELIGISSGIITLPLLLLGMSLWLLCKLYDRLCSNPILISDVDLRILFFSNNFLVLIEPMLYYLNR